MKRVHRAGRAPREDRDLGPARWISRSRCTGGSGPYLDWAGARGPVDPP
jgi:hypothetical protein